MKTTRTFLPSAWASRRSFSSSTDLPSPLGACRAALWAGDRPIRKAVSTCRSTSISLARPATCKGICPSPGANRSGITTFSAGCGSAAGRPGFACLNALRSAFRMLMAIMPHSIGIRLTHCKTLLGEGEEKNTIKIMSYKFTSSGRLVSPIVWRIAKVRQGAGVKKGRLRQSPSARRPALPPG